MEFKRCSKGHFYDPSVTSTCPQCAAEERMGQNAAFQADLGVTSPVSNIEDYGATAPVSGMDDYGATTPISGVDNYGATEPISGGGGDIGLSRGDAACIHRRNSGLHACDGLAGMRGRPGERKRLPHQGRL